MRCRGRPGRSALRRRGPAIARPVLLPAVGECHEVRNAPGGIPEQVSGAGTVYQSTLEFLPLPTACPCARGHTRNVLAEWHLPGIAVDAELVVSELMTNARAPRGALSYPWCSREELEGGSWV